MRRGLLGVVCTTAVVASGLLASGASAAGTVSVLGTVSAPQTYTLAQLGAMTQTSETFGGHTYTGVLLESVVNASSPIYPTAPTAPNTSLKNLSLRTTVTVSSGAAGPNAGPITVALGELDPSFGNNAGLLALTVDSNPLSAPELVLPEDTSPARVVNPVTQIDVAVQSPPHTAPATGALNVEYGSKTVTLSASQLQALPQVTEQVTFQAGSSPTNDTETGPTLNSVLAAAGITPDQDTYVASVAGTDGYTAVVTPAEATVGNRPLLISLVETPTAGGSATTNTPRLVADGDVKGGRYNSNVSDLYVGEGNVTAPPAPVAATVATTLSLGVSPTAFQLGQLLPGVSATYSTTGTATVTTSGTSPILTVAPETDGNASDGYLLNGAYCAVANGKGCTGPAGAAENSGLPYKPSLPLSIGDSPASLQPLNSGGAPATVTLASYQAAAGIQTLAGPLTNALVPFTISQQIQSTDALRTGSYATTLVFTLSDASA